jgi:Aromatic ring hydroxylase
MAIKTAAEYIDSVKALTPKVYVAGKRVENMLENATTLSVIRATAKVYDLANTPQHKEVMVATSHLTGEPINRNLHVARSNYDLDMRAEMALLTSQMLGTCNYRCVGCDTLNALAASTWEMDREYGTEYNTRLNNFIKWAQANDLACSGAITDPKGDRFKRPSEQEDPDMHLRVVEKRDDGIVVRGAKVSQSGAIGAHETIVLPGGALKPGEEQFAVAFALPNGTPGITYICQYTPYTAEREAAESIEELGNPEFGQRETSTIVFDDVFIPWERVFLCGETKYCGRLVARFAKTHRMNCGGACKVGYCDLIIGGCKLASEYTGLQKVPHIQEKLIDMVRISETSHACAIAAAVRGQEEPVGSGVYMPDDLFGNVAKLNIAHGFWEIMKMAGDIAGGGVVTMPSERDLQNPEIGPYIQKYFKSVATAEQRLRVIKFLQNWVAGLHGAGTWHGAGSPQAQRVALQVLTDWEAKKQLVKDIAHIKD